MSGTATPAPRRSHYALLALGFAAFTVYGSLVPFHFHARGAADALDAFAWVLANRVAIEARGDALANVLLGVPLGFLTLAALRADRPGRRATWLLAAALLPLCALFAAAVEFAQLFTAERTCSATDILAQSLGSALGLAAWLTAGGWATRRLRAAWASPRLGGRPGQRVVAYCCAAALLQMMPLDIDTSPGDLYRRLRDGEAATDDWAPSAAAVAALFLPAGLLLATVPSRGGVVGAFGLGLLLAAATEGGQLVVSRHARASDVFAGAVAVALGRAVARPAWRQCRNFRQRCAKDTSIARRTPTEAVS